MMVMMLLLLLSVKITTVGNEDVDDNEGSSYDFNKDDNNRKSLS